ncbi:translation elongation factor Ts [Flavobacteriales bacterium]|nr:translation elongation factor Ts [Flavobacteriales bacterium]
MAKITAADVNALRKQTGAGMMDCKKALVEADGDMSKAVDILRKKGQKVAANRADRQASEGVVISATDGNFGALIALNCETDFVAKNEGFISLAQSFLDAAMANKPSTIDELKGCVVNGMTIGEKIIEQTGIIGEKLDLSSYETIESAQVSAYIHSGNRLATLVGLSKSVDDNVGKDVAMQVAAMNPVAVDKDSVSQETIDKELEVAKDLARQEGKPEEMLEKIAMGRLNKFFKENTLLNQEFIKESKMSVSQHLNKFDNDLTVTEFKRVGLGV